MLQLAWHAAAVLIYLASLAYALLALWSVGRSPARREHRTVRDRRWRAPGLTVLKPLCGDEPELGENLRSFLEQDYPGELQIIFGARSPSDPALHLARRLAADYPRRDIRFVICEGGLGPNLKVANLASMAAGARHPLLAVSDSDTRVTRRSLAEVAEAFVDPQVGAVTCLYAAALPRGANWVSRLGALHINGEFLPSAMVAAGLGPADSCWGPLTVIRRSVIDRAGGFAAMAHLLADDHELGQITIRQGLKVQMPDLLVETVVDERSLSALFAREVRWARTTLATTPGPHVATVITRSLPLLAVWAALAGSTAEQAAVAVLFALRLAVVGLAQARYGRGWSLTGWALAPLLVMVRETLSLLVWAASFRSNRIIWRGQAFEIRPGSCLVEAGAAAERRPAAA